MEVFILCVFLQVCEQLAHVERRRFLVTAIMEETKQLQELAEYPSRFYDYVNMHNKRMQYVLYTTCSSAYQPDDNSTIGRGRCRYIFQNVSLTIKSRHLSWRRYMLLLGRTCRRGAHVQAVDQTTLKTEGTEVTWGMSYPVSAILDTRHR